jgi:hypothetical protein
MLFYFLVIFLIVVFTYYYLKSSWFSSDTPLQAWIRSTLEVNNVDKQKIADTILKLKDEQMETLQKEYKKNNLEKFLEAKKINKDYIPSIFFLFTIISGMVERRIFIEYCKM